MVVAFRGGKKSSCYMTKISVEFFFIFFFFCVCFGRLPKICRTNFHFYEREGDIKAKHFGHLSYGSYGMRQDVARKQFKLAGVKPIIYVCRNNNSSRLAGGWRQAASRQTDTYISSNEWCLPLPQCNSATASGTPLTDLHFNLSQATLAACV